jgi:hypothetical protein
VIDHYGTISVLVVVRRSDTNLVELALEGMQTCKGLEMGRDGMVGGVVHYVAQRK